MFARSFFISALTLSAPALADIQCQGKDPAWSVQMSETAATLTFAGRTTEFDIPHKAAAKGDEETIAYSLIADFDSAILIVHPGHCKSAPLKAHLMTQHNVEAILLSGCCTQSK